MKEKKIRNTYLSPDFAAEIKYKPKIESLKVENKVLRELLREVVSYPSLKDFAEVEDRPMLGWWIANELTGMNELIYEAYKIWSVGGDMKNVMNEIYDALVDMDFFADEDEVEESK